MTRAGPCPNYEVALPNPPMHLTEGSSLTYLQQASLPFSRDCHNAGVGFRSASLRGRYPISHHARQGSDTQLSQAGATIHLNGGSMVSEEEPSTRRRT